MTMLPKYVRVRVTTDRFAKDGVPAGTLGYVIEAYDDGNYEVEFSDSATGTTLAQLVVHRADVIESPEGSSGDFSM